MASVPLQYRRQQLLSLFKSNLESQPSVLVLPKRTLSCFRAAVIKKVLSWWNVAAATIKIEIGVVLKRLCPRCLVSVLSLSATQRLHAQPEPSSFRTKLLLGSSTSVFVLLQPRQGDTKASSVFLLSPSLVLSHYLCLTLAQVLMHSRSVFQARLCLLLGVDLIDLRRQTEARCIKCTFC